MLLKILFLIRVNTIALNTCIFRFLDLQFLPGLTKHELTSIIEDGSNTNFAQHVSTQQFEGSK